MICVIRRLIAGFGSRNQICSIGEARDSNVSRCIADAKRASPHAAIVAASRGQIASLMISKPMDGICRFE